MFSESFNILLLQKSKSLPPKLRQALRESGYNTSTVFNISDAGRALVDLPKAILLVDCGNDTEVTQTTIQGLVERAEVCDYPTVVIGRDTEMFDDIVEEHFILSRMLECPCTAEQVTEAIGEIIEAYPAYLEKLSELAPEKVPAQQATPKTETVAPSRDGRTELPPTPRDLGPQTFFDKFDSITLKDGGIGGALYKSNLSQQVLFDADCFPKNEKIQGAVRNLMDDFNKKERQHVYRAAFISGQSTKALNLDDSLRECGIGASFLYALSFSQSQTNLLKLNYDWAPDPNVRQKVGEKIRESGILASELDAPEISNVIHKISEIVSLQGEIGEDDISLLASIIALADFTDRVCFHSGYWDPHAASSLLRKLRSGNFTEYDPRVVTCIVRLLVEAIEAKRPAHLVPKTLRHDPALKENAKQTREGRVSSHETKVSISSLKPGMRLSRPLIAYDGRLILSPDLTLDEDLIWRLWRLACIKPLNTPLVVNR